MALEIDYAIGVGIFLIAIMFVVSFVYSWTISSQQTMENSALAQRLNNIISIADREFISNESIPLIGLTSKAYRLAVKAVNNLGQDIFNESLDIDFQPFIPVDMNSIIVYDGNEQMNYEIIGNSIKSRYNITAGETKYFIVYFDDDSSFPYSGSSIGPTQNNITEQMISLESIWIIDQRSLLMLSGLNYSNLSKDGNFLINITINESERFVYGKKPVGVIAKAERVIPFQESNRTISIGKISVEVGK